MPKPENSSDRMVLWLAVIFGLIMAGFGVWIWWTGGRQDVAGVLGGVFIFGGLAIVILALPKPRWWKD